MKTSGGRGQTAWGRVLIYTSLHFFLFSSEGGTSINLQTDLAPTSSPEELNSFLPPSGCGYEKNLFEKDHTYADERLGKVIDDVLDFEHEHKLQTPAVGSQVTSYPAISSTFKSFIYC